MQVNANRSTPPMRDLVVRHSPRVFSDIFQLLVSRIRKAPSVSRSAFWG